MGILGELRLILESEEFLQDWEEGECRNILQTLFDPGENARIQPQASFLSTFIVHVHKKCGYRVFQSLTIKLPESSEVKKLLQTKQQIIKEHLCGPLYASRDGCGYRKACFDAEEKKTEFDALVIGDGEKCIVEYEDKISGNLCRSLVYAYRVMTYKQRKDLIWLFVVPIRSKEAENKAEKCEKGAEHLFKDVIERNNWSIVRLKSHAEQAFH
jgi:hypothetical protein